MTEQNTQIVIDVDAPVNLPTVCHGKADFKSLANTAMKFMVAKMNIPEEQVRKEMAFAVQIAEKNPDLMEVTGKSLWDSLVNISNIGLTLNPAQKQAYLIPRKNKGKLEAVLQPSYMGLIKLCTDPGGVLAIGGGVVYEGDDYQVDPAANTLTISRALALVPRSKLSTEEKKMLEARERDFWSQVVFAYSRAQLHNGAVVFDMMGVERLRKIYQKYVKDQRDYAWHKFLPDEWCLKTVIAHHTKTLPKSDRAALAVELFHRSSTAKLDFEGKSESSIDAALASDQRTMPDAEDAIYQDEDPERPFV